MRASSAPGRARADQPDRHPQRRRDDRHGPARPGQRAVRFSSRLGDIPAFDASAADPGFAAFGHVVEGMDVVKAIFAAPRSATRGEGVMKGQMLEPAVRILKMGRVETKVISSRRSASLGALFVTLSEGGRSDYDARLVRWRDQIQRVKEPVRMMARRGVRRTGKSTAPLHLLSPCRRMAAARCATSVLSRLCRAGRPDFGSSSRCIPFRVSRNGMLARCLKT